MIRMMNNQQDENAMLINQPTNIIVVGAGTTGAKFVDNIVATLKVYGHGVTKENQIFVVMDSNASEMQNLTNIPEENKITIIRPTLSNLLVLDPDCPTDTYILGAAGGAGYVRRSGLAFYRYNKEPIKSTIIRLATDLIRNGGPPNFTVILLAGLFGGTGSSFLVELGLDLKNWLHQVATQVSTMGIGLLPYNIGANADASANAMAALKEISFIRGITTPVQIGGRQYVNPFDFFFLVSTQKPAGRITKEAEQAVTKLLIDLGFIPFREDENRIGSGLDWANLIAYSQNNLSEFSTFGLWSVSLPIAEVEWVINTEKEILVDTSTLDIVQTSVNEVKEKLEGIKKDLEEYSANARENGQKIEELSQELANGYPKLVRQIEGHQAAIANCKSSITEAEKTLPTVLNDLPLRLIDSVRTLLEKQKLEKEDTQKSLTKRQANDFSIRIPISIDGLSKLREEMPVLANQNLQQICSLLGQAPDFSAAVMTPLNNFSLLSNSKTLLNYQMEPPIDSTELDEGTTSILTKWGRARITDDTMIARLQRHKIGFTVISPSSDPKNLALVKDSMIPLVGHAQQVISEGSELRDIKATLWPYSIHFYSLLLGLPLYQSDTKQTPRLIDLGFMSDAYDAVKRNPINRTNRIIARHAFLFGDVNAFQKLTGISLAGLQTIDQRNQKIAEFWANYEIIEPRTKVDQIYLALAITVNKAQSFVGQIEALSKSIKTQCTQQLPSKYDVISINELQASSRSLLSDLGKLEELLSNLASSSNENSDLLNNQTKAMPQLVQQLPQQTRKHIKNCTEDTLRSSENCSSALSSIVAVSELVTNWLLSVQRYLARVPSNKAETSDLVDQIVRNHASIKEKILGRIPDASQISRSNINTLREKIQELIETIQT